MGMALGQISIRKRRRSNVDLFKRLFRGALTLYEICRRTVATAHKGTLLTRGVTPERKHTGKALTLFRGIWSVAIFLNHGVYRMRQRELLSTDVPRTKAIKKALATYLETLVLKR